MIKIVNKMKKQSFFSFLIFCAVFSEGIAVLTDENIEDSTELHIRKKRVIDKTRNGHHPAQHLTRAPYIVNILKNGLPHCAGAILESDVILSSLTCLQRDHAQYTVLSGSTISHDGIHHNIIHGRIVYGMINRLVMFKIFPPIDLRGNNSRIDPFNGHVPPNPYGTFAGWGCTSRGPDGMMYIYPNELWITRLPIITLHECIHYNPYIDDRNICTLDLTRRRSTCLGDQGGPLVYDDRLLGVLLHPGDDISQNPDIFIKINEPNQHQWVIEQRNQLRV